LRAALAAASCLVFAAALALWASEPRSDLGLGPVLANLREVDPGRFYRAGQLDADELRATLEAVGIRTIINLRGYDTTPAWYAAEKAVARESGVAHFDVHLSGRHLPRPWEVLRLLDLYRRAERPILVHCESGADRAGEAAALYQIEYMGRTPEQALEMLTLRYRHFAWTRPAKRHFVSRYRGEAWVRNEYDPCAPEYADFHPPRYCAEGEGRSAAAPLHSPPAPAGR
jgi:protein tyrosine/serine phosphatase